MAKQAKYYFHTFLLFGFLGITLTTLMNLSSLYLHEIASIFLIFLAFIVIYFWHPFRHFSLLSQSVVYIFLLVFVVSLWQYSRPFWQTWQGKVSEVISVKEAYKQKDNFTFFRLKDAKIHKSQLGLQEYETVEHYLHGSVRENHLIFLVPITNKKNKSNNFKVWLGESYNNHYRENDNHFMAHLQSSYQYFMKHPDSNIFNKVLSENKQIENALILMPVSSPQEMFYSNFKMILLIIAIFWLFTSTIIAVIELSIIMNHKYSTKQEITPINY